MQKAAMAPRRRTFRDNYPAVLLAAAFLLISFCSNGQIFSHPNGYGQDQPRGGYDSALYIPTGCGVPTDSTFLFSKGFGQGEILKHFAIYGDSCGHNSYLWDPSLKAWGVIGAGGGSGPTPSHTIKQYYSGFGLFVTFNTDSIPEGSTNKYYTDARARAAIVFTATGTGAATYNNSTGALNIPTPTIPSASNPSQNIDGTVHNGSASTFMRSDAVPGIANNAITFPFFQQMPAKTILGQSQSTTQNTRAIFLGFGIKMVVDSIQVDSANLPKDTTNIIHDGAPGNQWGIYSSGGSLHDKPDSSTGTIIVATGPDSVKYFKFTTAATVGQRLMLDPAGTGNVLGQAEILHSPATAATTAALPANTYNNGSSGVGATLTGNSNGALPAQDGVTLIVGNRLLVKNESAPANNGPYTVTQVGDGSHPYILTRGAYSSIAGNMVAGSHIYVQSGTTQTGQVFYQNTTGAITFGTTSLVYTREPLPQNGIGAGSCTNCNVTFDAQGRETTYTTGTGGAGSQTLQQTTALGNTTTIPIYESNTTKTDSIWAVNASLRGNIQMGDTILTIVPRWYFYGSSLTAGGSPWATYGWPQLMGFDRQIVVRDSAIGGTGISPNCPTNPTIALIHRIGGFPHWANDTAQYILIEAGVNDVPADSVAYKLALGQILDSLMMDYGFPAANIRVISPFLSPSRLYDTFFIRVNAQVANPRGIQTIDAWSPMAYAYYTQGLAVIGPDSLHPTQLGHKLEEMWISNQLKFGKFRGNVTISGNTNMTGALTVNGPDTLNNHTYLPGGIWQTVTNGIITQHEITTNGGDFGGEDMVSSNAADTIRKVFVGQSGNGSSYEVRHIKTTGTVTMLHMGGSNDNVVIGGSVPKSGFTTTLNGQTYVELGLYDSAGITIIGDPVYRQFQYPYFNNYAGTEIYSGCVSNEVQNGNSYGRWDWGTYNGTSFVANSGFNIGGTKFYVNRVTDDGTSAFLEVNGLFSTVGEMNTAGLTTGTTTKSGTTQTLDATATIWVFNGTSATTWTLPAVTGNQGRYYIIKNIGTATISLVPAGSDHIFDVSSVTSLSITAGSYIQVYDNASFWVVSNGGGGGGGGFTNPMSAAGQMIYGGTAGVATATATPAHAGMRPVWDGTAISFTDTAVAGSTFTIGALNATSTANGLTYSGGVLNGTYADATNGGFVSNTTQTFKGAKTFDGGTIIGFAGNQVYLRGSGGIFIQDNGTSDISIGAGATTGTTSLEIRTGSKWNSSDINAHGQMDIDGAIYYNSTSGTTGGIIHNITDNYFDANAKGGAYWRASVGSSAVILMHLDSVGNLILGTSNMTRVPSSLLTLNSTTQGVLFPRMTLAQFTAISSPATSLHAIITDSSGKLGLNNGTKIVTYATTDQLPVIASGTYTPTTTNTLNAASSSANLAAWTQNGKVIDVSGFITATPTTGGSSVQISVSLPVASTFSSTVLAYGLCISPTNGIVDGIIGSIPTQTVAVFQFTPTSSSAATYYYHFTYMLP